MSMSCPGCQSKAKCYDSRPKADGSVWRRYKCVGRCAKRWVTVESLTDERMPEPSAPRVQKRQPPKRPVTAARRAAVQELRELHDELYGK